MTWKVIEANNDDWYSCSSCYKQVRGYVAEREWINCIIVFNNGIWTNGVWFCCEECRARYTMQHQDIVSIQCMKPSERNPQTWFEVILPSGK